MSTPYEVPLSPKAQSFLVSLSNVTYKMRLVWNEISACWIMDLADSSANPIAQGLPVVTGLDMLYQLQYLGFVGALIVQTDFAPADVPTYDNLGVTGRIYYVVP